MFSLLQKSIELANNYDYLDRLFSIYPLMSNVRRNISENVLESLEIAYQKQDNKILIEQALTLELFPIKDAYVAFLKRFPDALGRNPKTLACRAYV